MHDVRARMEEITGHPARLDAAPESELGEREWAHIRSLEKIGAWSEGMPPSRMMRTLVRHPAIFAYFVQAGLDLSQGAALSARDRELIILRTGWLCGAPFQFGEHVERARLAGVEDEAIVRVKDGSAAQGWSEREAALLKGVEELHARAMIGDDTWALLAKHFDECQLVELPVIVGHYHMVAFLQNALRVPLNAYNKGLIAP